MNAEALRLVEIRKRWEPANSRHDGVTALTLCNPSPKTTAVNPLGSL